ncbi:fucolectin-like, partial [Chiloscyllium plagiosum]|uniref:fucolectin-like n=1 Tax=Chiloscyllium plagiosum TaxID=36176 RepID=UPI001CB7B75C
SNIAVYGIATQSSTHQQANKAIDGKTDDSCSITKQEDDPWWRLDLRQKCQIWSIKITNHMKEREAAIAGAEIRIGDSGQKDGINSPKCTTVESMALGATDIFNCTGMQGRYVNIIRPGNKKLTLCEVQVFGQPLFIIKPCQW